MKNRQSKYNFTNYFRIAHAQVVLLPLAPSPTEILTTVCNQLLVKDITTILYMTNSEIWGSNAASAQYLMQLTAYIGIPVIAWNADNIGLDKVCNHLQLFFCPFMVFNRFLSSYLKLLFIKQNNV